jgi:hypothetical protein
MIADTFRTVPRAVVNGYLRAGRLPITIAERIAGQKGNESWPPALAYERLEAGVEAIAGSLLGDAALTEAGRLRQARVSKLREAAELQTVAAVAREEAREQQHERKAEIAEKRKQTLRVAAEREQAAERQAEQQKRRVETAAARKKSAARSAQAAQEKAIERRERATRVEALKAETEALDSADKALAAEETADLIDKTIEGNKEARKTG